MPTAHAGAATAMRPAPWPRLAAYAVVAGGYALALHQLGHDSLWSDEIVTARVARQSLAGAWASLHADPNHFPLYYLLQWAFSWAGTSEWGLRLPSAFAATATVAAVYWLARELLDDGAGLAAAALLATHPAHLWAAQEARYYALIGLGAAVSAAGLLTLRRRPGGRAVAGFVLGTLAALYTYFFCLLMAAAESVYSGADLLTAVRRRQRRWRLLAGAGAGIAVLSLPLVPYALRLLRVEQGGSTAMVTTTTILQLWFEYGSRSDVLKYVFLVLALVGLAAVCRRQPLAALLCLLWFLPLPALALRQATHFFLAKYLYYLFPMYVALVGYGVALGVRGLARLRRFPATPVLLLAGLVNLPTMRAYYATEKFNWRDAAAYLASVAGPDDVVVTLPPTEPEMAWYYSPAASGAPVVGFGSGQQTIEPMLQAAGAAKDTYWIVLTPSGSLPSSDPLRAAFEMRAFYGVAVLRALAPPLEAAAAILPAFAASCGGDGVLAGPAWDTAGAVLERLQRPGEARDAYHRALAFYTEARVRARLEGDVARLDGDWPLAESRYRAATAAGPDLASVYLRLAEASRANEDGPGAVAAYLAYWRLTGTTPPGLCVTRDLLGELDAATVTAPDVPIDTPYCTEQDASTCYVASTRFTLPDTGEARDVLFQHPTTSVSFALPSDGPQAYFASAPLLDPQSWGWGSDGVGFRVLLASGGETDVLAEQVVTAESRTWSEWVVPLPTASEPAELRLETDAGPAGDATGDWAGWAQPLVVTLCDAG